MPFQAVDLALEQYKALRAEVINVAQIQAAVLGLALTASGVIGAVGFSKQGNREALLALPFILAGLTVVNTRYAVQIRTLGRFLKKLWTFMEASTNPPSRAETVPSWEHWLLETRNERRWYSPASIVDYAGQALILGVPSIGALAVTWHRASGTLRVVWWLDVLALIASVALAVAAYITEDPKHKGDAKGHAGALTIALQDTEDAKHEGGTTGHPGAHDPVA